MLHTSVAIGNVLTDFSAEATPAASRLCAAPTASGAPARVSSVPKTATARFPGEPHPGGPDPNDLLDDTVGEDDDINLNILDDLQPQNQDMNQWQEVP